MEAKAGRPPDPEAAKRLKSAALTLVREQGYGAVSVAMIIRKAGVSRQTLYNRWNSKAELVMEAFHDMADVEVQMPNTEAGFEPALAGFLTAIFDHLAQDGDTLRNLIASAQEDTDFGAVFYRDFVAPREEVVNDLLRAAQAAGALHADRDVATLSACVHGAFWYRLLNGLPLDARLAAGIAREIFA